MSVRLFLIALSVVVFSGCEVDVPQETIDDIKSDIITAEDIERIIENEVSIRVEEIQASLDECINMEIMI